MILRALQKYALYASHEEVLEDDERIVIALSVRLVEYEACEAVCRSKEVALWVYLILEGSVAITMLEAGEYTREALEESAIAQLGPPSSFGEVGVISNANRTANCVAFTRCKIMEIGRNLFKKTIGDGMLSDKRNKLGALARLPIFEGWTEGTLLGLLSHAKVIAPSFNTYLYRNGDSNNCIYVVLKGEVEVLHDKPDTLRQVRRPPSEAHQYVQNLQLQVFIQDCRST